MVSIKGLSAFPITPADPSGRVDTHDLQRLVARLASAGVDSIGLLGSTGTYAYLTREERRRALEAALAVAGATPNIIVGVGALRTDDAVRLARDAKAAGAAAGLLAAVSYTPLNDEEVFEHFSAVARQGGLPLCVYDNPATTHFRFSPALVGRLSRVEGIVAVKSPSVDPAVAAGHLAEMRAACRPGFSIGYSGDWNCTEALIAGADAWYSVLAGIMPDICVAIVRAARAGHADEARRLNASLDPLWALFKEYSSLRVVYAIAQIQGLTSADLPRPLLPLPEAARARVRSVIDTVATAAA